MTYCETVLKFSGTEPIQTLSALTVPVELCGDVAGNVQAAGH